MTTVHLEYLEKIAVFVKKHAREISVTGSR